MFAHRGFFPLSLKLGPSQIKFGKFIFYPSYKSLEVVKFLKS